MRTLNLKVFGMFLFIISFLASGLLINVTSAFAADQTPIAKYVSCATRSGDSYDIFTGEKCVNDTSPTLKACAPDSGDIYNIEDGKKCTNDTSIKMVGCKKSSGDFYDIYSGKRCLNTMPIACLPGSGHIYSINTGFKCTNDTSIKQISCALGSGHIYDIYTGRKCITDTSKKLISKFDIKTLPLKDTLKLASSSSTSTELLATTEDTELNSDESGPSGREKIANTLAASAGKVGSIVKGPMSIWIILLIIAILLTGGYAVYSLLYKKDEDEIVKHDTVKPVTQVTNTPNPVKPVTPATATPIVQVVNAAHHLNQHPQQNNNSNNPANTTNPIPAAPIQNTSSPQGQTSVK